MSDHFRELLRFTFDDAPAELRARVFGVDYLRLDDHQGGTMFATRYGWPLLEHLCPRMWWDQKQYAAEGRRVKEGTGAVYHVPTVSRRGRRVNLVVKFSRFAQNVPLFVAQQIRDDASGDVVDRAHFLSPFEEFGLLSELRNSRFGPANLRILTKRPLAIYKTPPSYAMWRLGREEWRFYRDAMRLGENQAHEHGPQLVELDADHEYVVLFGWVEGENAAEYARRGLLSDDELQALTERVIAELHANGFRVLDQKPAHFILRERRPGELLRRREGLLVYALVDFELLERTVEYEAWLRDTGKPLQSPS